MHHEGGAVRESREVLGALCGRCVTYFILREGNRHVVVEPMVEHLDRLLSQLRNAIGPHGLHSRWP